MVVLCGFPEFIALCFGVCPRTAGGVIILKGLFLIFDRSSIGNGERDATQHGK